MWNTEVEGFLESIAYVLGDLESFKAVIELMGNKIIDGSHTFYENEQENADEAKHLRQVNN